MTDTLALLAPLVALLVGLAAGRAWERYKLQDGARPLLRVAVHNPHAPAVHQAIRRTLTTLDFDPLLVRRCVELTHDAVFHLDPHVCMRCHYRSTELLRQCPQCHEWNTFVEERTARAEQVEEAPA